MGVKDLWQVLAPVSERKSLWELQGKTVAIDLSGWVCDSQNVVEYSSQPNMHLRNLFFRTSCLLLLGAQPVFVLEGDAPDLKLDVMSQRNASRGLSQTTQNCGKRRKYKGIQNKCQEMLQCMGVGCVQSVGEAEALCAALNATGVVDGCISQDSDCFLYGGQVVFRNFTISASSGGGGGPGFSIDMYRMEQVEKLLGLSRTKLVGLSLLCGCDYNQGVSGVGKETAVKFLSTLKDDEVFPRFLRWRNDPIYEQFEKERFLGTCDRCGHIGKKKLHEKNGCELCETRTKCHINKNPDALCFRDSEERKMLVTELNIRKKALQDKNFPCQEVIDEFFGVSKVPVLSQWKWLQPNLIKFMKFASKHLKWDECYSLEKFLPLVTRWLLLQQKDTSKCPIYPESIVKSRVLKGVASYEVKWADREGLFETLITEENTELCLTIEPKEMFEIAFPKLVLKFHEEELAKKDAKRKGKKKPVRSLKSQQVLPKCTNCGNDLPAKNQSCMCRFLKVTSEDRENKPASQTLEDLLDGLTLGSTVCKDNNEIPKTKIKPSKVKENSMKLRKLLGDNFSDSFQPTQNCDWGMKSECSDKNVEEAPATASPSAIDAKLSFEHLLEDEEWTPADFVKDDEIDLSDIVHTITGGFGDVKVSSSGKFEHPQSPTTHMAERVVRKHYVTHEADHVVPLSTPGREDSFEENIPYTPLIERVRKMHKTAAQMKSTSILSSLKGRRFSESFDAFCVGENVTSSPKADISEATISDIGHASGVTFSLGITNFLENSN